MRREVPDHGAQVTMNFACTVSIVSSRSRFVPCNMNYLLKDVCEIASLQELTLGPQWCYPFYHGDDCHFGTMTSLRGPSFLVS